MTRGESVIGRYEVRFTAVDADHVHQQTLRAVSAEHARYLVRHTVPVSGTEAQIQVAHTGARVPLTAPAKPHVCGVACTGAGLGTACACECAGLYHAMLHIAPELRPGYRPGPADPFTRLPQHDDEGAF